MTGPGTSTDRFTLCDLLHSVATLKDEELNFHSKKLADFDQEQADMVSERIIQKITKQFANHLKKSDVDTEESLQIIQQIFQLEIESE